MAKEEQGGSGHNAAVPYRVRFLRGPGENLVMPLVQRVVMGHQQKSEKPCANVAHTVPRFLCDAALTRSTVSLAARSWTVPN